MTDGESNGYYNLNHKHRAIFQEKGKLGEYKIEIDPATAFSPWANWAYINYLINQDPFWFKRLSSEKYQKLMNENRTAWGLETDPAKIRTDPFNTTEWKVLCGNRLNSRKFSTTGFAIYEFCTKLKNEIIPNNGDKFAFYPYGPGTSSDFNPYEKTKEYFESTYKGNTRVFEPVSGYEGSKQLYTVGIDYQSYKQGETQTSTNISGTQKPRDLTEEEIAQAIRAGICYKSDTVEQCARRVAKVTVLGNTISSEIETAVTNSSYTVEQDFVRSFDQKMDSYGWIIQLNAANGGALGAKNPAIDFVGTGAVTGGTYYFAAMRTLGIPSFRNVGASRDGYARTRDGDTGGDGKDYELGRVTHDEVENCFENLNEFILYQTTKQQQGILDWHGKLCPRVDMRRISWREIY